MHENPDGSCHGIHGRSLANQGLTRQSQDRCIAKRRLPLGSKSWPKVAAAGLCPDIARRPAEALLGALGVSGLGRKLADCGSHSQYR